MNDDDQEEPLENDYDLVRFISDLHGREDLGLVVRGHLHIEAALRSFVLERAPSPQHVNFRALDFEGTIQLALILGLSEEMKPALMAAANLRNKFSHNLEVALGDQEANNLFKALGPESKDVLRKAHGSLREEFNLPELKRQPPRERVIYCMMAIRFSLLAERRYGSVQEMRTRIIAAGGNPDC